MSEDEDPNYGIVVGRIPGEARYRLNGRDVSRDEALRSLDQVPDDRDRLRLTVVGPDELRRQVRDDVEIHSAFSALRGRIHFQDYPPDHWAVADVGLAAGITLQTAPGADGRAPVLFRMAAYAGPEVLAGAIRKADPLYRPERDPDPTKPIAPPAPAPDAKSIPIDLSALPPTGWAIVGLIVGFILSRRNTS